MLASTGIATDWQLIANYCYNKGYSQPEFWLVNCYYTDKWTDFFRFSLSSYPAV